MKRKLAVSRSVLELQFCVLREKYIALAAYAFGASEISIARGAALKEQTRLVQAAPRTGS